MHIMWFTERQYHYDPETEPEKSLLLERQILRNRSFFGLPNENFDPVQGSKLLNEYLDEKIYSEELGFDGLDINMGCPSRNVASSGSGAGLIRTPDLAHAIMRAARQGILDWAAGQSLGESDQDRLFHAHLIAQSSAVEALRIIRALSRYH